jgi:stage V sporulation protein R
MNPARTHRPTPSDLPPELALHARAIEAKAREYGLDFFPVVFEVLPFNVMNQIAAFQGFPLRYPHWRWGMEYEKLSKRDAYGMGRIYEMVINTDPVYAYLQESNALTDQKLVMAHVYGHADFFKHNLWFARTDRKMLDTMANHATRVRRHIDRQGPDSVERFLDLALSLESLIDTHASFIQRDRAAAYASADADEAQRPFEAQRLPSKDYMDPFINPRQAMDRQRRDHEAQAKAEHRRVPERPTRDVLDFLAHHAPLDDWQRDLLTIVRDEALYFVPQAMTKVMNEGWASYWHSKLMTQHFVEASEIVQYADQHSGVVHMPPGGFNPYKIGLELFKDIERRWDSGQHGQAWERLDTLGDKERFDDRSMQGREKIFQVRRVYNDVTFIEEFFTEEFCDRHRFYQARRDPQSGQQRVASRDFPRVKQTLLHHLTNRGEPFVYVVDANYLNRGELYLAHQWTGLEIDAAKAEGVLRAINILWGRPVHLQMRLRDDQWLLTTRNAGTEHSKERIGDDTPKPAHDIA